MTVQLSQSTFLVILAFSTVHVSQAYVSHNQTCDQSASATACDPNMYLSCRDAKCECVIQADMEWNEARQECVVFTGRSCIRSAGTDFPCVDDGYCHWESNAERICMCNDQRSPTLDGHCKRSHGATCEEINECNSDEQLVCNMDYCRCPSPLNHVFMENTNKCFIKVGAPCTPNPGANAVTCNPEENECLSDLESITGYSCQCLAGNHLAHFTRQCVKGNLQTCESPAGELLNPPCDTVGGLECNNRICECKLKPDQAWDQKQMACAVLEGRGCALKSPDEAWYFMFSEYFFHCFDGLECVALAGHEFEGICRKIKMNQGNATLYA